MSLESMKQELSAARAVIRAIAHLAPDAKRRVLETATSEVEVEEHPAAARIAAALREKAAQEDAREAVHEAAGGKVKITDVPK
jgi:hypothetical protein